MRIETSLMIPGRGEPVPDATIVVDGSTIVYAGPRGGAPTGDGDDVVVEVPVAMPGLWECHGHFFGAPVPDLERIATMRPVTMAAHSVADAGATLAGGVTSVREVGGFGLDLAPAIAEGRVPGPTIYGAGAILSTTGGHADIHGLPLDFVHSLEHRGLTFSELCDGVPACLLAVRKQLRSNAKVIKICASGGVLSEVDHPIHQQFSDEELAAIVAEAHRAERVVAAHCHGKPGIMAALRAGVTTIEHGSYLDEEAADLMLETGAILVPTRFVVAELLDMEETLPRYAYEKGVMIADRHAEAMKIAVAKGVPIAMGTDIFISGLDYGRNGREIRHLQDVGMTALEAIEAATANGPRTLGPQAPRSGMLAAGYDADVIALDFDPLADASPWGDPNRVTHVWKAGRMVKRPA